MQAQSFEDITVEVAIEPADDATGIACGPFAADRRFHITRNDEVLGWPGNLRQLLSAVQTPFFVILPHDDVLHPQYVESLLQALAREPRASVGYADMYFFGRSYGRKWLPLVQEPLARRLLSFYLGGAEAVPWRGVTRSDVLHRGASFPTNEYEGFAVESEWALHLLLRGAACRVERALYFKRILDRTEMSVSTRWAREFSEARLKAALEHHRVRMLSGFDGAPLTEDDRRLVTLACEAAMLRRYLDSSAGRFGFEPAHLSRAEKVMEGSAALEPADGHRVRAGVLTALSRSRAIERNIAEAESLARAAVDACRSDWEALTQLGSVLLQLGKLHEALELAVEAGRLAPHAPAPGALLRACEARMNTTYGAL